MRNGFITMSWIIALMLPLASPLSVDWHTDSPPNGYTTFLTSHWANANLTPSANSTTNCTLTIAGTSSYSDTASGLNSSNQITHLSATGLKTNQTYNTWITCTNNISQTASTPTNRTVTILPAITETDAGAIGELDMLGKSLLWLAVTGAIYFLVYTRNKPAGAVLITGMGLALFTVSETSGLAIAAAYGMIAVGTLLMLEAGLTLFRNKDKKAKFEGFQ